jgi:hypothetical protein
MKEKDHSLSNKPYASIDAEAGVPFLKKKNSLSNDLVLQHAFRAMVSYP